MPREHKIIFTGTPGVGKSTAVESVSGLDLFVTQAIKPEHPPKESSAKPAPPVGLDYGEVLLPDGSVLELYGTPGQKRFAFRWNSILRGALGIVILVDNSRPRPLEDLGIYLDNFKSVIDTGVAVIGVTRTEKHPDPPLDAYYRALEQRGLMLPVFEVDVRKPRHVMMLLDQLFAMLELADAPAQTGVGT